MDVVLVFTCAHVVHTDIMDVLLVFLLAVDQQQHPHEADVLHQHVVTALVQPGLGEGRGVVKLQNVMCLNPQHPSRESFTGRWYQPFRLVPKRCWVSRGGLGLRKQKPVPGLPSSTPPP